jgi:hypothetical protein
MHRSFKIQTFHLTSTDLTLIIEDVISLKLGLYYSNHCRENCRYIVAVIVTSVVLQPSPPPSRNLILRFTKEERFVRKQRMVIEPLPWFQRHEGRRDYFPNFQVRIVPNNNENLCHTQFLHQNQVLIICMTQDQLFHTYGQKGSQITTCHE